MPSSKQYTLTRRSLLATGSTFVAASFIPEIGHSSGAADPRFLTIILRGALDGLAVAAPLGDPNWTKVRDDTLLLNTGSHPTLPLDSFFGLNPQLKNFHKLYNKGEASIIHAVATPYRGRSHFDGQDLLESGYPMLGRANSGWLNRAAQGLTSSQKASGKLLAVGPTIPLIMRGSSPVTTWGAEDFGDVSQDTLERLSALYADTDQNLHRVANSMIDSQTVSTQMPGSNQPERGFNRNEKNMVTVARGAGALLARDDGPRIGALSFDGWDTHANQSPIDGKLGRSLAALDAAIGALQAAMAPVWSHTVVLVTTEFGRTVAENGTDGTDHGTASVALLLGGAVKGGVVLGDWPGLKKSALLEGRDLMPTTDLRSVAKGIFVDHLGIEQRVLSSTIFPKSAGVEVMPNLIV